MSHDEAVHKIDKIPDKISNGNASSDSGPLKEIQAMGSDEQRVAHAAMTDSRSKSAESMLPSIDLSNHAKTSQVDDMRRSDQGQKASLDDMRRPDSGKEIREGASKVVDSILADNRNDFGKNAFQRKQVEDILKDAEQRGHRDELVKEINAELARRGSDLQLSYEAKQSRNEYGHWGLSGSNPNTMEAKRPVWIPDYSEVNDSSTYRLTHGKNGRTEDELGTSITSRVPLPKPQGSYWSRPDAKPQPKEEKNDW